ncbi:FAD/NAD(P)-binding protein [Psychroserpens sp. XS_ASV72]|uniref:FAD/NAD(P)-binding protein n=1 Tax=Psychroserpens sp. XS_ASV72 TaxID=3241293 RepID=UPI0035195C0A
MKRLAIIGLGPRGLYALENLLIELCENDKQIHIEVFEPNDQPGAGQVWNTNQSNSNWINITERALSGITKRPEIKYHNITIESFASYHEWCNFSLDKEEADTFPPRNKMGRYLHERFNSLEKGLLKTQLYKRHQQTITTIEPKDKLLKLTASKNQVYTFDEVLLTIGHQPTELSDQLNAFITHANKNENCSVFSEAYPVEQLNDLKNKQNINIGIRGFGLASIDVIRYLVKNNFGDFKLKNPVTKKLEYSASKDQNLKIVPFSLDGLPLAPKPLNKIIDDWYKPSDSELKNLEKELTFFTRSEKKVEDLDFLVSPVSKIATRVYCDLKDKAIDHSFKSKKIYHKISSFLKHDNYSDVLIQDESVPTYELMRSYVNMALGTQKTSLDYCVWQVWRHCQPTFYKVFSYSKLKDEVLKKVIALDERSKRFSYGPPIESMQQLIALVDEGILDLNYTKDPEIKLTENGFLLNNETQKSIEVSVMINSVLDPPELLKVNSNIVTDLLKNDLVKPIHSDLGIETDENAYVKSKIENFGTPIAVLGRLAKGSVMGVDAILECFGDRIENWAKHCVKNLSD